MTSKVLSLLALGVVLLTAIACSDSDSAATSSTTAIAFSGDINDTNGTSGKPRSAIGGALSTTLVVQARYPDNNTDNFRYIG